MKGLGRTKFIQHSEGGILPDRRSWEYQYHLKDHFGNVRVTITAKAPTVTNYTAKDARQLVQVISKMNSLEFLMYNSIFSQTDI